MTPPDGKRAKELFQQAIELAPPERGPFLDQACRSDSALRERVDALLAAFEAAGDFLPAPGEAAPGEQAGERIGRYRLQQRIGEGGFGVVWMAEQQEPVRRQVALKIIKVGMDTRQVVARFEAERQALAMMDHPNIAKVLDGGETPLGRPFFVMELVRGVPITQFCDEQHLDAAQRLDLFVHVCHAVQHAHHKGVIHRDLKPGNVLVTLHDGVPVPKVIDFGIAKATQRPLTEKTLFTEFRQMVGTPEYMAPEQAEMSGLDIDTRADVYSLGVLLYELLTGSSPFGGLRERGMLEMLRVIREDDPPKPSTHVSTSAEVKDLAKSRRTTPKQLGRLLRGDLDWIVMKALEKDRARRYETANSFAEDVLRHLRDEPVLAGPPGAGYRLRKYVRRHRVGVMAGVMVGTALIAGLGASVWGFVEASEQAEVAEKAKKDAIGQRDAANTAKGQAELQRERANQEKARAEAREAEAKREATRASTVLSLVESMLRSADPHETKGRDYKVRQLLDDFDRDLGSKLASEPEVEATVHRLIGNAYRGLGLHEKAEPHLAAALSIRQRVLGDGHAAVAESLCDEADLLEDRGDFTRGLERLAKARSTAEAALGPQSALLADILRRVADHRLALGDLSRAEMSAREAMAMHSRLAGDESSGVARSLRTLAGILQAQGNLVEAEAEFRRCLAMTSRLHQETDPAVLNCRRDLAEVLQLVSRLDEAEEICVDVVAQLRRQLGDEHPRLARAENDLALVVWAKGRFEEAEGIARQALAVQQKLLGAEHVHIAETLNTIGIIQLDRGEAVAGEQSLRKSLAMAQHLLKGDHAHIAITLGNLGRTLEAQGRHQEAEGLHRQSLAMQRKLFGPQHPDVAMRLGCLGNALKAQGKGAASVELYQESLLIWQKVFRGEPNHQVARMLNDLGATLSDQGKHAEAEPLLQSARDMWCELFSPMHEFVGTATINLANCYETLGRLTEAATAYREALEIRRSVHGSDHESVGLIQNHLGLALWKLRQTDEAEAMFRASLAVLQRQHPDGNPATANVLDNLWHLLAERGRRADAIGFLQQEIALHRRYLDPGSPDLFSNLLDLSAMQSREGQFAGAEASLRELLALLEKHDPQGWAAFQVMSLLGAALDRQGKLEEAERMLLRGYQKIPEAASLAPNKRTALARLIKHYEERGKTEEAARWRKLLEPDPKK